MDTRYSEAMVSIGIGALASIIPVVFYDLRLSHDRASQTSSNRPSHRGLLSRDQHGLSKESKS